MTASGPASQADLLNVAREVKLGDKTFHVRSPTLLEQGRFQRWLETRAWEAIERRATMPGVKPADIERDRKALIADIAAGVYSWGGRASIEALGTTAGLVALFAIVTGEPEQEVEKLVDAKLWELVAAVNTLMEANDPKALRAALKSLGMAPPLWNPGRGRSSNSATRRSATRRKKSRR